MINQIRDRIDIAEVIGQHVSLSRAGQNLKGLCPFHQEKTPSFTVSSSRQIFHCFGCGAGGNVFSFLMRITGSSFPDTVRELGQKVGIEVKGSGGGAGSQGTQSVRIEQLNRAVASWFQENIRDQTIGAPAREYLLGRVFKAPVISGLGIGYAPLTGNRRVKALRKQGFQRASWWWLD